MNDHRQKVIEIITKNNKVNLNPSEKELLALVANYRIRNKDNLIMFKTNITSRSKSFTKYVNDVNYEKYEYTLSNIIDALQREELIVITIKIGMSENIQLKGTTILSKEFASKALMLKRNFYFSDHDIAESDMISIDLPHFEERLVMVDYRENQRMTYITGIDYYGEHKMSHLRMAMEMMRTQKNGLGLHAGSKIYDLENNTKIGMIIFGLSGTGKTTLTTHDHNHRSPISKVGILQDDIVFMDENANIFGSENGMYVKCADVPGHKQITKAVLSVKNKAVIENVHVSEKGEIDWFNFNHTKNSRAMIMRESLENTTKNIDLPQLDIILFNTRRPELPPIIRLMNSNQIAAYYALGESIITSAETKDKELIGSSKRVVGFDPFIINHPEINIMKLKKIVDKNRHVKAYVVNTGYVQNPKNDIPVNITLKCIEGVLSNKIEWQYDERMKVDIPKKIDGFVWEDYDPKLFYENEYEDVLDKLRNERIDHLEKIGIVDNEIINSI